MAERICIPTPELDCPARRALEMEGHEPLMIWTRDPYDYGLYFTTLWASGLPFVIVEHDIIPWPGSVQALIDCPEPWCTHRYPLHRGNVALSFGIGKYVPTGPAPEEWAETPWQQLDGAVVPVLNRLFGRSHVHEPPVAHARRQEAAHA
jgi:hypothetical protein